jgi:putative flippase GtrA
MGEPATVQAEEASPVSPQFAGSRAAKLRGLGGLWFRFALVGLLKTALDFASFNIVLFAAPVMNVPIVLLANTIGFSVAVSASFVLNARFTFRVAARSGGFRRYVLISLLGLVIYNGSLAAALALWHAENVLALNLAKSAALVTSMTWNFLGYRYFVFRPATARSS